MSLQYQPSLDPPYDPIQDEISDLLEAWTSDPDLMIEDLGHSRLSTLLSRVMQDKDLQLSTLAYEVVEEKRYADGWSPDV